MMRQTLPIILVLVVVHCAGAQQEGGTSARQQSSDVAIPRESSTTTDNPEPQRLESVESLLAERDFEGAFVVRREHDGAVEVLAANPELAAQQVEPCSTVKIPNTLIGLETGVIPDASFTLPWDGQERHFPSWNRDHDLTSALEFSVVWYFQEVARRVGHERMSELMQSLDFGNASVGDAELIDSFWLGSGPLRISPVEQVQFLTRLTGGELEISPRSVRILRQAMPRRERAGADVVAKTGTCMDETGGHAWLVGWVEREGRAPTSHFALLLVGERAQLNAFMTSRWDLAFEALEVAEAL